MATTTPNPRVAPTLPGNTRHAYVRATTAASYPVTITAASNDQFEFNELEYLIPAGTYATPQAFADAINLSTNDEDNASTTFQAALVASVSKSDPTKLLFTSVPAGALTLAFGTGAEHDAAATMIVADGLALAGGDPVD
jgi:hypothetical protein